MLQAYLRPAMQVIVFEVPLIVTRELGFKDSQILTRWKV